MQNFTMSLKLQNVYYLDIFCILCRFVQSQGNFKFMGNISRVILQFLTNCLKRHTLSKISCYFNYNSVDLY